MSHLLYFLLGALAAFAVITAYACCVASSRASREEERLRENEAHWRAEA